jgi:methionine-rich copper-binding protein CopC
MKLFNTVFIAASLLLSSSVSAHVGLSSSMPANGAMLSQAPTTLELTFTAPVRLVNVIMQDEKQQTIPLKLPANASSQASFSLALPSLTATNYKVNWMIMGDDGHKMKGELNFMLHDNGANTRSASPMSKESTSQEHAEHQ